jgi:hypothetical protein
MATLAFVTPEEFAAVKDELAEVKSILRAYVNSQQEWLLTKQALATSGIKTRETLVKYHRATKPNAIEPGRIIFRKEGKICLYLRSSCIDFAQRKLGQPTLTALAA